MKNKKNLLEIVIICVVVIVCCTFSAHAAFAYKKAVFPDAKSLQPIPQEVRLHIPGNINSTIVPEATETQTPEQAEENNISNTAPSNEANEKDNKSAIFYVLWSLIILSIIFTLFFIYKKLKQI